MERRSHNWPFGLRLVLAPTRALFDSELMKARRWDIKHWTVTFLILNGLLLILLPPLASMQVWTSRIAAGLVLYMIPFSRVFEIFYAFYYDALEKISSDAHAPSSLKRGDRFRLLGVSYLEISVCFAIFFRAMPQSWFNLPPTGMHTGWFSEPLDWLYFSWITITTTGYGDVSPVHPIARVIVMAELGLGLLLVVFAVGSYFAYKGEPQ